MGGYRPNYSFAGTPGPNTYFTGTSTAIELQVQVLAGIRFDPK